MGYKKLALINELNYYECAIFKAFSEVDIAVLIDEQEARIKNGSVFSKAKVSSIKFRLVEPANRAALYRAFLLPQVTRKNWPVWVRCTEYTEVNESRKLREATVAAHFSPWESCQPD